MLAPLLLARDDKFCFMTSVTSDQCNKIRATGLAAVAAATTELGQGSGSNFSGR